MTPTSQIQINNFFIFISEKSSLAGIQMANLRRIRIMRYQLSCPDWIQTFICWSWTYVQHGCCKTQPTSSEGLMEHLKIDIKYMEANRPRRIFFSLVPSYEETSFQPPSKVCISVIIHFTHYKLQILNGPLCAASMYCFVHQFLDMWGLIFVVPFGPEVK